MPRKEKSGQMHGTTILCIRREGKVVMAGDGQVTLGDPRGGKMRLPRGSQIGLTHPKCEPKTQAPRV